MNNRQLILKAKEAMGFSYSPYSKFRVGAAVLTIGGRVYTGCNIENATYSATNCAERTAVFKAVSEGERELVKIAVVSDLEGCTFPCGICRQVLTEFMPEGLVVLVNKDGSIREYSVKELLPHAFILES